MGNLRTIAYSQNPDEKLIASIYLKNLITNDYPPNKKEHYEMILLLGDLLHNRDRLLLNGLPPPPNVNPRQFNIMDYIQRYLREDLINTFQRSLLHLEVSYQNEEKKNTNGPPDRFYELVGRIRMEGGNQLSGTLIALPRILPFNNDGTQRPHTYHVLTCAHILDSIPKRLNGLCRVKFYLPNKQPVQINSITVFKKQKHLSTITNLPNSDKRMKEEMTPNTVNLTDLRAVPQYDSLGDVAILNVSPYDYPILDQLNVKNSVFSNENQHIVLTFEREIDTKIAGSFLEVYHFHFIDDNTQKEVLDGIIMKANNNSNAILGYPGYITGNLVETSKRSVAPLFEEFVRLDTSLRNKRFRHDAPTYWGMSGGPIFFRKRFYQKDLGYPLRRNLLHLNNISVYGVVHGVIGNRNDNIKQCAGAFLQKSVIFQ